MTRVRRLVGGLPLRVKLAATMVVLLVAALGATSYAGTTALRGYLVQRVDSQLQQLASVGGPEQQSGPGEHQAPGVTTDYYVVRHEVTGATLLLGREGEATPNLPPLTAAHATAHPVTVGSVGSGPRWRVEIQTQPDGDVLAVAVSLASVDATIGRLQLVELAAGLAVLVATAAAGHLLVRRSLRPLAAVERTAAAIAAGDLSRRVPDLDPRTEVGQLSTAINVMLARIEEAFAAQAASERAARESEERMRRFIADASHELRTPLTSIRGFAELYRQGAVPTPADVATAMRRIEQEGARMGLLVDDLLLLARLDQHRPLETAPVDLTVLAADAVHDARAVEPQRPLHLRTTGPVVVNGDDPRLRQVLGNLVTNALRHTPPGTPVEVRVRAEDSDGILEVVDRGPGLTAEQAQRVFERFYRVEQSRDRAHGGAGLGLSIVAALVDAHGGRVELDTAVGSGSTFRVRLPLAGSPQPARTDVPAGPVSVGA